MTRLAVTVANWSPRARRLVLLSLCTLAVAAVVGAGIALRADHLSDSRAQSGREGRAFAVEIVPKLLSYDFDTVEQHFAEMQDDLGGDFRTQFEDVGRTVIVPSARERQVVTTAEVLEAAVVAADTENVDVLLFLNQSTTSSESQETKLDGSRVRVHVERADGGWLITELTPV
ncbi:hypothetical protein [Rhodococcus sp. APC 3903]|uniref:hypothetical protein n=1 Tax=Rhodococcus sp. APC 3903 TaxID=3035193 RepID=UPI0025B4F84E|nr:hypothetical protein [Rhodococcus sp. APC 3903]MDN3459906.1 hypothetical protein [Rhodococcus sp. APC 3903]